MQTSDETTVRIEPADFTGTVARRLVAAALADLADRYGDGDSTPLQAAEFTPPDGMFLVAYRGDEPVGCAGWRTHGTGIAELKRMYTAPTARRLGVARRLLAAVEASAGAAGRHRIVLETGDRQPEAIALYAACGYQRIPNYGYHKNEPGCVAFGREL